MRPSACFLSGQSGGSPWVKKPKKYRYWSCPRCAKWYEWHGDDEEEETTTTAEADSHDVQQLKAESVELKAEIEILKAEIVELKSGLKAVVDEHVASDAVRDDVVKNLKQMVETLAAQVTKVPEDDEDPS